MKYLEHKTQAVYNMCLCGSVCSDRNLGNTFKAQAIFCEKYDKSRGNIDGCINPPPPAQLSTEKVIHGRMQLHNVKSGWSCHNRLAHFSQLFYSAVEGKVFALVQTSL